MLKQLGVFTFALGGSIFITTLAYLSCDEGERILAPVDFMGDGMSLEFVSEVADDLTRTVFRGNTLIVQIATRRLSFNKSGDSFVPDIKRYLRIWQSTASGVVTPLSFTVGDVYLGTDDSEMAGIIEPERFYNHSVIADSIWYDSVNGRIFYTNGYVVAGDTTGLAKAITTHSVNFGIIK